MGDIKTDSLNTLKYLRFYNENKIFLMYVNNRNLKFNATLFDVLLNAERLSATVNCEIIAKKCLPFLL